MELRCHNLWDIGIVEIFVGVLCPIRRDTNENLPPIFCPMRKGHGRGSPLESLSKAGTLIHGPLRK